MPMHPSTKKTANLPASMVHTNINTLSKKVHALGKTLWWLLFWCADQSDGTLQSHLPHLPSNFTVLYFI